MLQCWLLQPWNTYNTTFHFLLESWLTVTKISQFVQYTPRKKFDNFVQPVVDANRAVDENPLSGVVAKLMKLLRNSSYGYQILDRSKHTVKKYLENKKKP